MATTFTAGGNLALGGDRTGPAAGKGNWFARAYRALVIARAQQALRNLNDRSLAHMGISRSEIPELARQIHDGFRAA